MERLAALVPPPRAHQVLYHGLFAPRSKWRSKVLPQYRKEAREERKRKMHRKLVKGDSEPRENNWVSWAYLLRRVFGVDGFSCPNCSKTMRVRNVLLGGSLTKKILRGLSRHRIGLSGVVKPPSGRNFVSDPREPEAGGKLGGESGGIQIEV